jgi:hypothetical protein
MLPASIWLWPHLFCGTAGVTLLWWSWPINIAKFRPRNGICGFVTAYEIAFRLPTSQSGVLVRLYWFWVHRYIAQSYLGKVTEAFPLNRNGFGVADRVVGILLPPGYTLRIKWMTLLSNSVPLEYCDGRSPSIHRYPPISVVFMHCSLRRASGVSWSSDLIMHAALIALSAL